MEGEDLSIAAPELETAIEAPATTETTTPDEPERIPSPEEVSEEQQAAEAAQVEDDFDDYEHDGKTFKAPKSLKEKLARLDSMDKDYTTKSQTNAEKAKALDALRAQAEERLKATDEELNLRAQARQVEAELERFKDFGWQQYQEALRVDPLGAEEAWAYVQHLKEQKNALGETIKTAESKRSEVAQQEFAKRVQETLAEATKIIPGSTPETVGKAIGELAEWAHSRGIPEQALKANWSPQLLDLLYHAKLGHNLRTKQAAAPRPTVVPQPLKTVNGSKAPVTSGDLGSLDMEAYVAARKKGVGGKPLR